MSTNKSLIPYLKENFEKESLDMGYEVLKKLVKRPLLQELVSHAKFVYRDCGRDWKNRSVNVMPHPSDSRLPVLLIFDGTDSFEAYWHSLRVGGAAVWNPFPGANRMPYRQLEQSAVSLDSLNVAPPLRSSDYVKEF